MKQTLLIIATFLGSSLFAQIDVTVSGNIFNTNSDSIYIAQFYGTHYKNFVGGKLDKEGNFQLSGKVPSPDYYVFRIGNEHINIILRDQSSLKIYGDGKQLDKFVNILGSDESAAMNEYLNNIRNWQARTDSAMQVIQKDPTKEEEINNYMTGEYQKFQGIQKSFIARNPNSAALYPAISVVDPNVDFVTYEGLVKQLIKGFPESPSVKQIEQQYLENVKRRSANDPLAPGKAAPDFEELMRDGVTTMKLSDLKGQVVLLDFWAAWCGPCRRENPFVVEMYNKYKDEGFTVMSVSLDKAKENWLAAIEQDKLVWPNHVSDLQYWNSKAAKLYGVSGIPFTVLIDREGKIINTKLRGEQLHDELKRIFGH